MGTPREPSKKEDLEALQTAIGELKKDGGVFSTAKNHSDSV